MRNQKLLRRRGELQLESEVATVNIILRICQEKNEWKIDAIEVSHIDELLKQ